MISLKTITMMMTNMSKPIMIIITSVMNRESAAHEQAA